MSNNKFKFYEIVKVSSDDPLLNDIEGFEGAIRGMSQNEETGEWGYAVSIFKDEGFVWDVLEKNLISTGKNANPDDYITGESVRVRVDSETGAGEIVEDE